MKQVNWMSLSRNIIGKKIKLIINHSNNGKFRRNVRRSADWVFSSFNYWTRFAKAIKRQIKVIMATIIYRGEECIIKKHKYANNNRVALVLYTMCGQPYATLTTNVGVDLAEDEVAVKTWSENDGILQLLMENNIVSAPLYYIPSGFVEIPICKLLI